jgi:hypothetical protein
VVQIHFSATPFMSVAEAKTFALATRTKYKSPFGEQPVTDDNWNVFSRQIAFPNDPAEFIPASVDRLMRHLDPYIVRLKGMRPQFHARNGVELVDLLTIEDRLYYEKAVERYQRMKAKIAEEAEIDPRGAYIMELAARTIYRKAAEETKAKLIAKRMFNRAAEGYAPVAALNYKISIIKCVMALRDLGVKRDDISIIWGGGQSGPTAKQKKLALLKDKMAIMQELGIGLDDFDLDEVDEFQKLELPKELRLGPQNIEARNIEKKRFQSGRSIYCFYTFKAGGVGLSLHHCDDYSDYKVKRTRNNWYVIDDIVNCPVRPRIVDVGPTYSAVELAQGLGRCPRLTSMSDTIQTLLFYRGTVEQEVAETVSRKLTCLREVVRTKESWEDIMFGHW